MTCHNGFVRKKSQTRRQHKPRKQGVQTSSKEISVTDNDARQGHDPMTAFPEFATPADIASMRQAASRALSKGRVAAIGMVSSIYSAECARPDGACRAHPHVLLSTCRERIALPTLSANRPIVTQKRPLIHFGLATAPPNGDSTGRRQVGTCAS